MTEAEMLHLQLKGLISAERMIKANMHDLGQQLMAIDNQKIALQQVIENTEAANAPVDDKSDTPVT